MIAIILTSILAFWLICAYLAAAIFLAYVQNKFKELAHIDYRQDLSMSIAMGLLGGPVGLVIAFFITGFAEYGINLKLKRPE